MQEVTGFRVATEGFRRHVQELLPRVWEADQFTPDASCVGPKDRGFILVIISDFYPVHSLNLRLVVFAQSQHHAGKVQAR